MESQKEKLILPNLNNYFNFKCFNELHANKEFLLSPLSITYAMLMTYFASESITREELKKVFGIKDISDEQLMEEMSILKKLLSFNFDETKLILANATYIKHSFQLNEKYQKKVESFGTIVRVNFMDPETVPKINQWVSQNTRNLINNLLSSSNVGDSTQMILLNTLYFKGTWMKSFDKKLTTKNKFLKLSNEIVELDLMHKKSILPYFEDENCQVVELPYHNNFVFGVILPKNSFTFPTDPSSYHNKLKANYNIILHLPKFTQRNKMSLKETFKFFGVNSLFDKADLSNMTTESNIKVDDIIHEVVITVEEEGTEAAAATAVIMKRSSHGIGETSEKIFRADHTFMYYIRDLKTNIILFNGVFDG